MLICDASVAVKLVVRESGSDEARALLGASADVRCIAPAFMLLETLGVLAKRYAAQEIALMQIERAVEDLEAVIEIQPFDADLVRRANLLSVETALALARGGNSRPYPASIYDCCYVALAASERATLLTADLRQSRLARAAGCATHFIKS